MLPEWLILAQLLAGAHIFVHAMLLERGEERDEGRGGESKEGEGKEGGGRREEEEDKYYLY